MIVRQIHGQRGNANGNLASGTIVKLRSDTSRHRVSGGSILGSVCRASTVRMLVDQQAQLEYWRVQHCLSAASVEGTEVPQVEDEDRDSSTTGG